MGAAVSVTIRKLPEELDSAILQKVCGDKFDQQLFNDLKDIDGFVARADLLAYIDRGEQAVDESTVDGNEIISGFESLISNEMTAMAPPQGEDGVDNEDNDEIPLSEAQLQVGRTYIRSERPTDRPYWNYPLTSLTPPPHTHYRHNRPDTWPTLPVELPTKPSKTN